MLVYKSIIQAIVALKEHGLINDSAKYVFSVDSVYLADQAEIYQPIHEFSIANIAPKNGRHVYRFVEDSEGVHISCSGVALTSQHFN